MKLLGMIDRQTGGKLFFEEHDTEDLWKDEFADIRRRKIGFVFQDFYLMDSLSVRENIMLPKILDKKSAKECMEESQKYAEQFGITHLMNKKPYELSGGEKQRVAISRALINNPDLILADEPTGSVTLVQHYPKTTPVIFWSLSILISLMTERQSVRFSSRVKFS